MIPSGRLLWMISTLVYLALVASACGSPSTTTEGTTLPPPTTPAPAGGTPLSPTATPLAATEGPSPADSAVPAPTGTAAEPSPSTDQEVVVLAKEDLAQRLNIAPELIIVRSIEPVTWADSSLGCPQPGVAYLQVVTPGHLVVLTAMGETYEYHTDRSGMVMACDAPIVLQPIHIPPKSADDRTPWQPVDGPTVISP